GWPSITFAKHVEVADGTAKVQRQTEEGYDEVVAPLPAVVSVTAGVVEPRYPSFKGIMAAKNKPVDEVKVADLGLSEDDVGWKGARQEIVEVAPVEAFYGGADADAVAETLGKYGATKVYAADLGDALPGAPVAAAMAAQIEGGNRPDLVLFGQTYDGRDVAGRLSVKLDRPTLTNGIDISANGKVEVRNAIFGGNTLVQTAFDGEPPFLALFRPKSFSAEESGGAAPEVVKVDVPDTGTAGQSKVLDRHVEEHTGPKLDEAAVVVSGGRGLGSAEKYEMIEQLAKLVKGAPGASRAIVDAGWV